MPIAPSYIYATDYGVAANWNGSDATSTDDTTALRAAIAAAATWVPTGMFDQGGCAGNAVQLPKGTLLISDKIVIPSFVKLIGAGAAATVLKMSDNYPSTLGFIDCGDAARHAAAFSCGIQDLYLYSRNTNAYFNRPMLYTNNAQDCPVVQRCKIVAGNGSCIWFETGWGGASKIDFTDITVNNNGAHGGQNLSAKIISNYGDGCEVSFRNIVMSGPGDGSGGPDATGIWLANGSTNIDGFHAEWVAHPITVAMQGPALTDIQHASGGDGCTEVVRIMSPTAANTTTVRHMKNNGSSHTVNAFGSITNGNIVAEHLY